MIILPCPIRPDLDCTAGAVAYADYLTKVKGQEARAWICGTPDAEAQFYLDRYNLPLASDDDAKAAEAFVLVDFSVGHILPSFVDHQKVIQVIDHRFFNKPDKDFPNAKVQLDAVGAAATQVTEYYMRDNIVPSAECAAMLYGAISTHTLFLRSTTTTDRDRIALDWLKTFVPDADALIAGQLQARVDEITNGMPGIFDTEMKHEKSHFGDFGITQLELRGVKDFWNDHKAAVITWAATKDYPVMVNMLDPFHNLSVIFSSDERYTQVLSEKLSAQAVDNVFLIEPGLFRKQIIPLLQ